MKRIKPQQVLDAAEKCGFPLARSPQSGDEGYSCFFNGRCVCGLGAIFMAAHVGKDTSADNVTIHTWLRAHYYPTDYIAGFVHGFDGNLYADRNRNYLMGYADGQASAEAAFGKAVEP